MLPKCVNADHRGSDAGQEAEKSRPFSQYLLKKGDSREPTYADTGEGYVWVPDDNEMIMQSFTGEVAF